MDKSLITVVTATLNSADSIKTTFDSVIDQGIKDVEYIVVDGISQDGTVEIIKEYQNTFLKAGMDFKWISEKDQGIYDALNKGIRLATGKYIIFMGAGDYFFPGIFTRLYKTLEIGKYDFVYGNSYNKAQNIVYNGKCDRFRITVWPICHQAVFYKTEIFERLGYYDLKYRYSADYHFNIKCFSPRNKLSILYVKHIISVYEGIGMSAFDRDLHYENDLPDIISENLGEDVLEYYLTEFPKKDPLIINKFITESLKKNMFTQKDKFVIYGTANWGEKFYNALIEKNIDILAFSDSNREKWGTRHKNIDIVAPESIKDTKYDKILIASSRWAEIRDKLVQIGYEEKDIVYMMTM